MLARIYDKTDKGREEIATRKHQLPNRLRPLLVLIDGKQAASELLKKVIPLGLDESNLRELIELELITPIAEAEEPASPASDTSDTNETSHQQTPQDIKTSDSDVRRFQDIYLFYNDTIKSTLGLRGFTLQLKVERANTLEDFQNLRNAFLEAVMKAKGRDFARELRNRLDTLLYEGETRNTDAFLREE